MEPTISILALCYNHEAFLEDALQSLSELPENVEVLIADDSSKDGSVEILRRWEQLRPDWFFLYQNENRGNCATFNELLSKARGEWILDFATDDLLRAEHLLPWASLASSMPDCGFCYADALIFHGKKSKARLFSKGSEQRKFPEGRILHELFSPGLICPPAVLFSKKALVEIGGYNEELSYEDMDCWLRLARRFKVCRYPEPVIFYRQHSGSMSAQIYQGKNLLHLQSTLKILVSILQWPEFQTHPPQLLTFIRYHLRLCFFLQLPMEAGHFFKLLEEAGCVRNSDRFLRFASGNCPAATRFYQVFRKTRSQWNLLFSK